MVGQKCPIKAHRLEIFFSVNVVNLIDVYQSKNLLDFVQN